jgi:hypothetical protein
MTHCEAEEEEKEEDCLEMPDTSARIVVVCLAVKTRLGLNVIAKQASQVKSLSVQCPICTRAVRLHGRFDPERTWFGSQNFEHSGRGGLRCSTLQVCGCVFNS